MAKKRKAKAKASAKKRAAKNKVIATRRSTAGTGFEFEDYVSGWLLLQALAGRKLPVDGHVQRVQSQVGALRWDIDDVLLTAQAAGEARHLAISCKGNVQVTANGLPKSFSERAWALWTKADTPLDRATDVMALATQGTNADFQTAWSDIKEFAAGADPKLALAQIAANPRYRKIFGELKNAAGGQTGAPADADTLSLVNRLEVLPFDFRLAASKDERDAIATARSLLAGGTQAEAKQLWDEIVGRAQATRLRSGTLEISALIGSLRVQHRLKDFPDFEPSWNRLRALSADTENVIQTALPSGERLDLKADAAALRSKLDRAAVVVVHGESGTGKSAQVKSCLDHYYADVQRIWLAPEHLEKALNQAELQELGLAYPLARILEAASQPENILVIDAAERLSPNCRTKAQQLVAELVALNEAAAKPVWRVIIIGQTEAWANGELQTIAGQPSPPRVEIRSQSTAEVAKVLLATPGLGWLTAHQDALQALTNLRTLGWVIQATALFQDASSAGAISLVTIADKLWVHWTGGKAVIQGLLMRLAARDAAFEHSIGLSKLDAADQKAFDERPPPCPVRLNSTNNHVQFEHDLAADWARFQQLKEIADDTAKWAPFAENPLWNGALRMLGQHLLRQVVGTRTAWDVAFDTVQAAQGKLALAEDILLDALFLDPAAATVLESRAELLFANNARLLQRLLARFDHVATVSGTTPSSDPALKDLGIYLEAKFRTPIVGRWPALAQFLTNHRARVAELILPIVSMLAERWLTSLPLTWNDGSTVPYRREFAELALATARERQLSVVKGDIYMGEEDSIYQAAFAAAMDMPDEVGAWSLEMARRRPLRADLGEKLHAHRDERAAEHRRKMESDEAYRERHERKRSIPYFSSARRLPPWPLGPKGRVDNAFAEAVHKSNTFQSLMRARQAIAAEVLLATLIEDAPEKEFGSRHRSHEYLGLEYDHDAYPTAYWKSPFFVFLHIDSAVGLDAFLKLVSFCMDRWDHERLNNQRQPPARIDLKLRDGSVRSLRGGWRAFAWSQDSDHFNGQLFSALAALEKWLCGLIDQGVDVTAHIERLLKTADNVAVIGVLINVGKRQPELFRKALRPLLVIQAFYVWDEARVRNSAFNFDGLTWSRSGNIVFEMARDWYGAAYRQKSLVEIVSQLCREDHELGDFVNAAAGQWDLPLEDKERVELQIRVAQLDYRNYRLSPEAEGGEQELQFECPADVRSAIDNFQRDKSRTRKLLAFPDNCKQFLAAPGTLSDAQSIAISELMLAADGGEAIDLDEGMVRPARVATAVVLLLGAKQWLNGNPAVRRRALDIVAAAMEEVAFDKDRSRFFYSANRSFLEFIACYVFYEWLEAPSAETDAALLKLFTSGDDHAAGVIAGMAFAHRASLGDRWWRLLYLGLLWSGLAILKPRVGRAEANLPKWTRWAKWLLTRRLSGIPASIERIRPLEVAQRVEEHEARQWEEEYRLNGRPSKRNRKRRMSGALETHFLESCFAWLVAEVPLPTDAIELEQRRLLISRFWAHQAWRLIGSERESSGDYTTMDQFGYKLLGAMAPLITVTDVAAAPALWQPVLDIGPKGHHAIEFLLSSFFSCISESADVTGFVARWRPLIEAVMAGKGWEGGPWYYQERLERHVLGFANTAALMRLAPVSLVEQCRDLYGAWAKKRLGSDEDNLAAFCNFLSSQAGAPLRLDSLVWVGEALRTASDVRWYRDGTSAAFVGFLSTVVTENGPEAVGNPETRQALIGLTGIAVSRQLSTALAIQDRLKGLL